MDRLDFVVPGAQRAGTSSLYSLLSDHPETALIKQKDSYFFSSPRDSYNLDQYSKLFTESDSSKIFGDVCANYYWNRNVPKRILDMFGPSLKIIFMLRDPIERAFSSYHHLVNINRETRSPETVFDFSPLGKKELVDLEQKRLDKAIENGEVRVGDFSEKCENPRSPFLYLRNSFYWDYIQEFSNKFGSENVHLFFLEDLRESPRQFIGRLYKVLGVDAGFVPQGINVAHHKSRPSSSLIGNWLRYFARRVPESVKNIRFLREIYEKFQRDRKELPVSIRQKLSPAFHEDASRIEDVTTRSLPEKWDLST